MLILHEILADSSAYPKFFSQKLWRLLLSKLVCPGYAAGSPCALIGWGSWYRKPKAENGEKPSPVRIQRFHCTTHQKTISFLPPFLLPRLHYLASIVNGFVERYVGGENVSTIARNCHAPEERTIRRWVNHLKGNADQLRQSALQKIGNTFYTSDRKQTEQHQQNFVESLRPFNLINAWALLKTLANRLLEHRLPYHYALVRSP
jgi:hypothetical protein